jgi:tetratricopeptide (TPR) repeat protein
LPSAQQYWKKAMAGGLTDATLCYEYAIRLGAAGVPEAETRGALERAVALKPDFDDARYQLALLELNTGHVDETIAQLRALKSITPKRAFQYWATLSYALEGVGMNEEAKQAANRAKECATTPLEQTRAERLAYTADTELAVQFTRDANGRMQAITTRVQRGTVNHNPFIEPGDQMREARGQLKAVECQGQITGIVVDAPEGTLRLSIPDPLHVQILNGPSEFQCGAQSPLLVVVSYALASTRDSSQGVVRGIEFP